MKENEERKEVRKRELSKQWRAAWMAVVFGMLCFGGVHHVSADYVTVHTEPLLPPVPAGVAEPHVKNFSKTLERVLPPVVPVSMSASVVHAQPQPSVAEKAVSKEKSSVLMLLYQGALELGDLTAAVVEAQPQRPAQLVLAGSAMPPSSEGSLARLVRANKFVADANTALFGMYADALSSLVASAHFDALQFAYVWDKTFGAFGERYVTDLRSLNDMQVAFYFAAADKLEVAYNTFADVGDSMPQLDTSISVASVGEVPLGEPLDALMEGFASQVDTASTYVHTLLFGDTRTPGCGK